MRSESLMVQYVAVRCSVLQIVSACDSVLQCGAVCCSELQAYDSLSIGVFSSGTASSMCSSSCLLQ